MRSRTWLVVRCLLGLGILVAILAGIDFDRLSRLWRPAVFLYLVSSVAILVAAQLVSAARWRILLLNDEVRWAFLARLYLVGTFFSAFLPTSVGGDAVRIGALAREGISLRRSVASVLFDRFLGVLGMIPLFATGALLVAGDPGLLLSRLTLNASAAELVAISAVGLCVLAGSALFFRRRMRDKIIQFGDELRALAGSRFKLSLVVALGVVVQAMYVAAWAMLMPAARLEIGWPVLLFAVPVVSIAAMLPVSIAGLGVREGVWIVLLGGTFAAADVVGFSLLYFVAFSFAGAVGGVLYMLKGISTGADDTSGRNLDECERLVSWEKWDGI